MISEGPWYNLSLQDTQPTCTNSQFLRHQMQFQPHIDLCTDDPFMGGACLELGARLSIDGQPLLFRYNGVSDWGSFSYWMTLKYYKYFRFHFYIYPCTHILVFYWYIHTIYTSFSFNLNSNFSFNWEHYYHQWLVTIPNLCPSFSYQNKCMLISQIMLEYKVVHFSTSKKMYLCKLL